MVHYRIKDGEVSQIEEVPFSNETKELENFVIANERIFGQIAILNHQISTPDGYRIDLWGLDTLDMRPVIIELKNVKTGLEIIPQIIPYYVFVKSNPDTLKFKAITNKKYMEKLKELGINEEKLYGALEEEPKVIIIAPEFEKSLLEAINYWKFIIEPIEISQHKSKDGLLVVNVNRPQISPAPQNVTRVMEDWDWDKYLANGITLAPKNQIAKGLKQEMDNLLKKNQIELEPIFRKGYIPYQSGRNNVFWFNLGYTSPSGDIVLGFAGIEKKPDLKGAEIVIEHTKERWVEKYHEWNIFFNKVVDLSPLLPIIKKSFEAITGEKLG